MNMFRNKFKRRVFTIAKLALILVLVSGLSGCRELSDLLQPAKNVPKKPTKVVKRDKPNLADDETPREVDPDGADLVEATDEQIAEDIANLPKVEVVVPATNANAAEPSPELAAIEQKARALAGKWEPVNDPNGRIFEFTEPKREGDTFVGTFNFYVNGDRDPPSKYVVSVGDVIKLIQSGAESKIICKISADGRTMQYTDRDGEDVFDMRRTNAQPVKKQEQPRATPPNVPDLQ